MSKSNELQQSIHVSFELETAMIALKLSAFEEDLPLGELEAGAGTLDAKISETIENPILCFAKMNHEMT
jgi:hypothetical protein